MENLVCCFQSLGFSLWAVGDMRKIVNRGWKWDDVCFRKNTSCSVEKLPQTQALNGSLIRGRVWRYERKQPVSELLGRQNLWHLEKNWIWELRRRVVIQDFQVSDFGCRGGVGGPSSATGNLGEEHVCTGGWGVPDMVNLRYPWHR